MSTLPFRGTPIYVGRTQPHRGERCEFHPGCCDPDDFTCPGCGAEATGAITYSRQGQSTRPAARMRHRY